MTTKKTETANTDAVFDYFRRAYERAIAEEENPVLREAAEKAARASEWHTLFAVFLVAPISAIFDNRSFW